MDLCLRSSICAMEYSKAHVSDCFFSQSMQAHCLMSSESTCQLYIAMPTYVSFSPMAQSSQADAVAVIEHCTHNIIGSGCTETMILNNYWMRLSMICENRIQ